MSLLGLLAASMVHNLPVFKAAGLGAIDAPGAGGALDLLYPVGYAVGDRLIAIIYMQDATAVNVAVVPSGWTQVDSTRTNVAGTVRAYCITRVVDGTDTGTLTVSLTDGNVDVFSSGRIFSFSSCSIDTSSSALTEATNTTVTLPSVTPSLPALMFGIIAANGPATFTVGTQGYTEADAEYSPGSGVVIGAEYKALTTVGASFDDGTLGTSRTNRVRYQFALR